MLLKAKCDHIHHACTDGFAPIWWKRSRRAFSLLTAYQILNADFYFQEPLTTAWIRVTIPQLRKEDEGVLCSAWPHVYHPFLWSWPHVAVCVFLLWSLCISSLPAERFSGASATPNQWPHDYHSILGFDHIFDHKQNRSTRRQECTRVWKSRFCVAERAKKSKNG